RTPENQWSNNRSIKNIAQLREDLDSMSHEHNQWVYYNYINTGSTYSFFTRDRKIEVPEDIQRKKQVYDSLQNIKLQQEYQARTDSIARASAQQTQENTSGTASDMPSNSSREVVASSAPFDSSLVLGDSVPEE